MKKLEQIKEQEAPATSVAGGGIAGIRPDEIPPVGKGITTAGHMLRRKKPLISFSKFYEKGK